LARSSWENCFTEWERSAAARRAANQTLVAGVRRQYVSLPFDDLAAEEYARLRA